MRQMIYFLSVSLFAANVGCESLHVSKQDQFPLAIWTSLQRVDSHGNPQELPARELVLKALSSHGLHPTIDSQGVSVSADESELAREILLTDKSVAGSGALVFLFVPAGSCQKTTDGFEISRAALEVQLPALK